jgi:hypothetical protein
MDHIVDFTHGGGGSDVIELNGFNFSAASTAAVTATTVQGGFTAGNTAGYFGEGNVVHVEKLAIAGQPTSERIYVDANKSGSFEVAADLVIHLDNFSQGLTNLDFQFH